MAHPASTPKGRYDLRGFLKPVFKGYQNRKTRQIETCKIAIMKRFCNVLFLYGYTAYPGNNRVGHYTKWVFCFWYFVFGFSCLALQLQKVVFALKHQTQNATTVWCQVHKQVFQFIFRPRCSTRALENAISITDDIPKRCYILSGYAKVATMTGPQKPV